MTWRERLIPATAATLVAGVGLIVFSWYCWTQPLTREAQWLSNDFADTAFWLGPALVAFGLAAAVFRWRLAHALVRPHQERRRAVVWLVVVHVVAAAVLALCLMSIFQVATDVVGCLVGEC